MLFHLATGSNQYITLDFISMETECAYDYLFIYDGNSYSSPLLGSFSGGTLPDRVLATSGYVSLTVLIVLSSGCLTIYNGSLSSII